MQATLNAERIPFILWTLYDFDEVPNSVVGRLPWRKNPQRYFGLINTEGKKKPVFEIIVE